MDSIVLKPQTAQAFRRTILAWSYGNLADYEWRRYADPWFILLAEILLRKTNAEKVRCFIPTTLSNLSSPQKVEAQTTQWIARLLQPYGMQSLKARQIKALGRALIRHHDGKVPRDTDALLRLPGVGRYIANAVACFAFGKRTGILDTNVIRLLERVFGIRSGRSRPRDDPLLWALVHELLCRTPVGVVEQTPSLG